jgi:hypothetical protein
MCATGYHLCNGQCLSNGDDPSSDPCVVADSLGIFVSPGGNDSTGNGTKMMPYATIKKAADIAATGKKRVYACGTFTSGVALTAADDGVTIYGGLDCTTWAYSMSTPTKVAPTSPGYAFQVTGASGVTFEDFAFTSMAGVSAGDSSIAMFAANSTNILLRRCSVQAGAGVPGQDQTQPAPFGSSAPSGKAGGTPVNLGAQALEASRRRTRNVRQASEVRAVMQLQASWMGNPVSRAQAMEERPLLALGYPAKAAVPELPAVPVPTSLELQPGRPSRVLDGRHRRGR